MLKSIYSIIFKVTDQAGKFVYFEKEGCTIVVLHIEPIDIKRDKCRCLSLPPELYIHVRSFCLAVGRRERKLYHTSKKERRRVK